MQAIRRVIIVAIAGLTLVPVTLQGALAQQNGPRSDGPGQGDVHSADPCALAPDLAEQADSSADRCALGGSGGVSRGDFNNDGIADLAVGVPDETRPRLQCGLSISSCTTTDQAGAGAVNVIYGGSDGLTTTGNQILSQSIRSTSANAHLGRALAAGNFRGPGFASDLAVGAPGVGSSGAIYVFFSASGRLSTTPNQTFFGNNFSAAGTSLDGSQLAFPDDMSMVWGDFNEDGFGDLAAEVKRSTGTHDESPSAVLVLYGSASGFSTSNYTVLVIDDALGPRPGEPEIGQSSVCPQTYSCVISRGHVGLAVKGDEGDFLLLGSSHCNAVDANGNVRPSLSAFGCVAIVPGKVGGPRLDHFGWHVLIGPNAPGVSQKFGAALAVGDFDGSDHGFDVAVGDPEGRTRDQSGFLVCCPGVVSLFLDVDPGFSNDPQFDDEELTQNDDSGSQVAEDGDRFGAALAANDFDGDGISDLAVGSPGETSGNNVGHGLVTVFFGAEGGLPGPRAPSSTLGSFGTVLVTNGAAFGSSLSAWNFGRGPLPDLAIGSPGFTIRPSNGPDLQGAGGVLVLYEATPGLFTRAEMWTQDPGFPVCSGPLTCLRTSGRARAGNHFGAAVY